MPSARREGIRFSNMSHRSYRKSDGAKRCSSTVSRDRAKCARVYTGAGARRRRPSHRSVVSLTPHTWNPSLIDPHWSYILTTHMREHSDRMDKGTRRVVCRFSDFERLVDESGMQITLPAKHWVPFFGKCMDNYEDAAIRAAALQVAIEPLFSNMNPTRDTIDDLTAFATDRQTLTSVTFTESSGASNHPTKRIRIGPARKRHLMKRRGGVSKAVGLEQKNSHANR